MALEVSCRSGRTRRTAPAARPIGSRWRIRLGGGDARSGGGLGEMTRRKREIVGLRNERDFPQVVELVPTISEVW